LETVKNHYDDFLGSVYSWIIGDFDVACVENKAFFESLELRGQSGSIAVDLGCGPGCQSVPLAEAGFEVVAIDFCQELLDELKGHAGTLPVRTLCADILKFKQELSGPADVIVCMGDTLVHLADMRSVESLLVNVAESLAPGGTFIYAIRDYVNYVPAGPERFVPIRANDEQIFTCFLDYKDDVVHVHDVLYRKTAGEWTLNISDYLKLRIDSRSVDVILTRNGLIIADRRVENGMITVVARRPN
jgi:SAM-dependent methyltransferase